MASSTRLRHDVAALFKPPTPHPDIVLPSSGPTELMSITLHLLGPASTPYAGGAWKLTLTIPANYPAAPPKAHFDTKIFHPNVAVGTGEVCVDTLKRDWTPQTDLRHVLLVIRCLLIEPNPESALNEEAGKLLLEDYADFERRARLMTVVHALKRDAVVAAAAAATSGTDEFDDGQDQSQQPQNDIYDDGASANPKQVSSPSTTTNKNVLQELQHLTQRGVSLSPQKQSTTTTASGPTSASTGKVVPKSKKKVGMKRL
ncbi:ubiquitin-conjugating enzyme/RWD-like protein [Limtongia smithiae]|uniref:ubiquitin-conjugating enzyme/RWD-like protein n=1 Tax=Limtongia smithiae TaxID=1125753 RepID=UPI0034D01011